MSSEAEPKLVATDLPIMLYLNQRLTFDLLAVLQGGFSRLATVQTTSTGGTSTKASGEAQLGASNVFAFLGVKLRGQGSREAEERQSESSTQDFVHTPASLFAQLRRELRDHELVRYVSSSSDLTGIRPSDFVEFEATLRRSPLIEFLDSIAELMPLMKRGLRWAAKEDNVATERLTGVSLDKTSFLPLQIRLTCSGTLRQLVDLKIWWRSLAQ